MRRGTALAIGVLACLATAVAGEPEAGVRAALARLFDVPAERAATLEVEVEAIENGPEGRRRLPTLESELAALFAAHGLPPARRHQAPDAIAVTCRVGQQQAEPGDSGWAEFRWDGSCDLSRRGVLGLAAVRAGGESHPDAAEARERARGAARRAMLEALSQRLDALAGSDR